MIDNPQVGQEVVTWSHNIGAWKRAEILAVDTKGGIVLSLILPATGGDLHIKATRRREDCYTLDNALPLLLWEAAGHYPGEENEHHGRTH